MSLMSRRNDVVTYNGCTYSRVSCTMSMVISASAKQVWKVAAQFGNQASWLGTIDGHAIYTQLLGGHIVDYIGAVRVTSIGGKTMFERLTTLDSHNMVMEWNVISHPLSTNPFPASFLNCKASLKISPVVIPGNQSFVEWRIDLLTELHAIGYMRTVMEGIMRVGLLNIQRNFTMGGRPPVQKRLMPRQPSLPPIAEIPQPPVPRPSLSSAFSSMSVSEKAQENYVSAPISQQPTLVAERVNNAASYMEMTIPLLHEARVNNAASLMEMTGPLLHEARCANSYLVTSPAGQTPQCGAMSETKLQRAQSCQDTHMQQQAGQAESCHVTPPSFPQNAAQAGSAPGSEDIRHVASTDGNASIGSGDRSIRKSLSGGDRPTSSCSVWEGVSAPHMARSASQPLD